MIVELNTEKSDALSKLASEQLSGIKLPFNNKFLISFWLPKNNYMRIYPNQTFFEAARANNLNLTSSFNHLQNLTLSSNLETREFWGSKVLYKKYLEIAKLLNIKIDMTYIRVFSEIKVIFQLIQYDSSNTIKFTSKIALDAMSRCADNSIDILKVAFPGLENKLFITNKNYRDNLIYNITNPDTILNINETATLYWLSVGKRTEEIALICDYTIEGVKSQLKRIKAKLMAMTNAQCVAIALRYGLI